MKLYDYPLSGNCYKVRLLLSWLQIEYEKAPIDFYPSAEHKTDWFLEINPLGQIPVLQDDDQLIRDAQAILVHLAANYDNSGNWYPRHEPKILGHIQSWLAFADEITATCSAARLHDAMFYELDVEAVRRRGKQLLEILDEHLWFRECAGDYWICTNQHPTIADVACFPYVALCEEGGISQVPYTAVQRWIERFMRIEGFEPMPGMMPLKMPSLLPDISNTN